MNDYDINWADEEDDYSVEGHYWRYYCLCKGEGAPEGIDTILQLLDVREQLEHDIKCDVGNDNEEYFQKRVGRLREILAGGDVTFSSTALMSEVEELYEEFSK